MEAEWTLHHKYELGEHLRYLFELTANVSLSLENELLLIRSRNIVGCSRTTPFTHAE